MKAITQDVYGGPEVLKLEEIERPSIGDDEVLVRVRAAGVDPGVWHIMTGKPYLVRLFGFGVFTPKAKVRGLDVAGVVEAVGSKVTRFRAGDEVFGNCDGAFAEFARAKAEVLIHKPAGLSFEEAAVIPVSAATALAAVRDVAKVQPGQSVLVIGAAGGVGSYATQLAKAMGAEVTGVCSGAKAEFVRQLGASHVVDYTREDFVASGKRYDVIIDTVSNRSLSELRSALTPKGTLAVIGGEGGGSILGMMRRVFAALFLSPFVSQSLKPVSSFVKQPALVSLVELIVAGKLKATLGRVWKLEETGAAIAELANGHARGKSVIAVS